jgi:hypothetical protein
MYATARTDFAQTRNAHHAPCADDADARLNWLVAFHAADERVRRDAREREEVELMTRPVDAQRTYRLLGALLGLLPPAAIFYRVFGRMLLEERNPQYTFAFLSLLVAMNVLCWLVGRLMAGHLGERVAASERGPWLKTLWVAALCGFAWAAVTGAAGGLLFFGIGALFGPFFAVPCGVAGFVAFTILHRLLARGGMIEARNLRPLAWGVALTIAAFILGM